CVAGIDRPNASRARESALGAGDHVRSAHRLGELSAVTTRPMIGERSTSVKSGRFVSGQRRLVLFVAGLMALEVMPAYAVAALLPHYVDHFGLSKVQAGVVSSAYVVGTVLASIPVALLARRIGVRRGVVIGLVRFALGSTGFGLSESFATLTATRFIQGVAGG